MAVFVFTSGRGAPGVTTSVLALARQWPRPAIVLEADPCGSSAILAGYLRGQRPGQAGVVEAAVSQRQDTLAADLPRLLVDLDGFPARLLPGLSSPAQIRTMVTAWPTLAPALAEVARQAGMDLLVDAGRLGALGYPQAILATADRVLLTVRTDLPSLHAASVWLAELTEMLADPSRLGLLVVGEGDPYGPAEIAKHLKVGLMARLAWDPTEARCLSHGQRPPRKPGALERSTSTAVSALMAALSPTDLDLELTNA